MKLYNIVITSRTNGSNYIIDRNITEAKAEKQCEEWGWIYNDGTDSYYMSYEESTITTEALEVVANSFLADLQDAFEIETDENLLAAIKEELYRRNAI